MNVQSETKNLKIPLTIEPRNTCKSNKTYVEFYTKSKKMLMKELKEDLNK